MSATNGLKSAIPDRQLSFLLCGLAAIVCLWLAVLAVQLALRCAFPWDLFTWAESPFMTDMLKLDMGNPVYGPPEDGNSFVYSPGLAYITFAILKPLGLQLDIRYCRAVTVLIGLLAALFAGLSAVRSLEMIVPGRKTRGFSMVVAAIAVLVIFKNFTADATHPDNLTMLHTTVLLWLTLNTVKRNSIGWAAATIVFAAAGVFSKQTMCVAFMGPSLVFFRHDAFSLRNRALLALTGVIASSGALAILWRPEFARFYTWDVLTSQPIQASRLYLLFVDFLHADRAMLAVLAIASLLILWQTGKPGSSFLQVWIALGIFSVAPGTVAYVKCFGLWNNIIIHQLWLLLLVMPALTVWLTRSAKDSFPTRDPFGVILILVVTLFVLALFPTRLPADQNIRASCAAIQERVTADIASGRRVLVSHGAMYQILAGSKEIPLDRANSILELNAAGMSHRVKTVERISSHYYDRLYLVLEHWHDAEMLAAIQRHYQVDEIIPKPSSPDRWEFGRSLILIGDCKIMSPRADVAPEKSDAAIAR